MLGGWRPYVVDPLSFQAPASTLKGWSMPGNPDRRRPETSKSLAAIAFVVRFRAPERSSFGIPRALASNFLTTWRGNRGDTEEETEGTQNGEQRGHRGGNRGDTEGKLRGHTGETEGTQRGTIGDTEGEQRGHRGETKGKQRGLRGKRRGLRG